MLPPIPPPVSNRDFDPATAQDEDLDMEEEVEEGSTVELSSVEINILIYLYLLESNLSHTAFTLLSESSLPSTSLFQHFNPSYPTPSSSSRNANTNTTKPPSNSALPTPTANGPPALSGTAGTGTNGAGSTTAGSTAGPAAGTAAAASANGNSSNVGPGGHAFGSAEGRIPRGELIRKLWKGLRWEEVERHVAVSGEAYKPQCPNPFHLLIPHSCPAHYPSAINNPPKPLPAGLRVSPPPPESRRPEAFPAPDESDTEAGPSRPRKTAQSGAPREGGSNGTAKRSRIVRASSEDRDDVAARRSASPDLQARKEKRDKDRARDVRREGEREGKRPRLSDVDSDRERERVRDTPTSRDKDRAKALKSGKDKERDRDRDKDRDKERVRAKERDKDRDRDREVGKDRVSKLAAESEPVSREDSPVVKRKKEKERDTEEGGLAPPARKGDEARSKSPGSTASGPIARPVNGASSSSEKDKDKPSSRGPGRPPKNPPSTLSGSKVGTAKRRKQIESPPPPTSKGKDKDTDKVKVKEEAKVRGKDNPAWIKDEDVAIFVEHRDAVSCLAWNPKNPSVLATGSLDGTARLWEFADPTSDPEHDDVDMTDPSSSSPSATSHIPSLTDVKLVKHPSIDSTRKTISALAWHPEGSMLGTGCWDGVSRLITPDGQIYSVMTYGAGAINGIKFSPGGRWVLTPKSDFSVGLWAVGKGKSSGVTLSYDAHTSDVNDVDWLDDDVFASGANDHRIYVFRTSDKNVRYTFRGHNDDVTKVRWSPSPVPSSFRTGSSASSASTPIPPAVSASHQATKANHLLASVSDDGYLMIWRMPSYPAERAVKSSSRSVSPVKYGGMSGLDGEEREKDRGRSRDRDSKEGLLDSVNGNGNGSGANGSGPENVSLLGLPDYCIAKFMVSEPYDKRLNTLEWAPVGPEGEMIIATGAEDSTVKLFNVLTSETLHTLPGLKDGVRCLAFSRLLGGKLMLAAAGWNGQVYIYDVRTGEKKGEWAFEEESKVRDDPGIRAMTWREDGQYLAVCNGNKAVALIYTGEVLGRMSSEGPLTGGKQDK